ncbi:acyl-CoA N-acyltransferase [Microdochium trichocladiopsis]|uniref:Acyl-CoA N-acyltransferase n=1 Tax=Microdochium trichocladiopsis TaxID=1682393 RepID=A0A9P8Y058_9PEZI|nr:acyl-CoA N-acyltransferase [Microdochium trichocladiopsis]KAH7026090.1 acyl-CoA N-acyltransferase [Microdochium trichocladiopsis]
MAAPKPGQEQNGITTTTISSSSSASSLPFPPPSHLHPSFTMLPAQPADLEPMCDVYYSAFATDPGNTFWWPPRREQMMRWLRARVTKKFADPAVRHYKIVHAETGQIAAWASTGGSGAGGGVDVSKDIVPGDGNGNGAGAGGMTASEAPTTTDEKKNEKQSSTGLDAPEGVDPAWCEDFFSALKGMHAKWEADQMLGLSLIATSPDYQRRGAAKALIAPLLAVADRKGLRTYLEATPAGRPVYGKLGFREVDSLEFDVKKITGGKVDVPCRLSIMVREPVKA